MFQVKPRQKNIPDRDLLDDIRNVAKHLQKSTITSLEYGQHGRFGVRTIVRRFGWNQALRLAGLEIKNRQNIPEEEFFENIADVWKAIGKQPVGEDLNKGGSKIPLTTYELRFGSWNKALLLFSKYIGGSYVNNENLKNKDNATKEIKSRTPRRINWRIRAVVLIRDNCICKMCGASPAKNSEVELHVDHIIPWSKGGETLIDNLQTLCSICNIGKSNLLVLK